MSFTAETNPQIADWLTGWFTEQINSSPFDAKVPTFDAKVYLLCYTFYIIYIR